MPEPEKKELTYDEARTEAGKTGGSVGWSIEQGYYVKPGFFPAARGKLFGLMPWETALGEGIIAPWTRAQWTPEGYRQARPPVPPPPPPAEPDWLAALNLKLAVLGQPPLSEAEARKQAVMPKPPVSYKTISEGGWDFMIGYDEDSKEVSRDPLEQTRQAPQPPPTYPVPTGTAPQDPYGRTATWDADNAEWRYPPDWGTDPATQKAGYISPWQQAQVEQARQEAEATRAWQQQQLGWQREQSQAERQQQQAQLGLQQQQLQAQEQQQQQQFGLQQQQFQAQGQWQQQQLQAERQQQQEMMAWQREQVAAQQAEQQRQMVAQLGANPRSWLEYASYTGQTPTVQPWMLPLMPQQYGLQVGQPIPGYSPQGMAGMPEMTQPSAQLWGRMGPTAQQQMIGYGTARTGVTPEEQQWRMWSQAPPSGQASKLQWQR